MVGPSAVHPLTRTLSPRRGRGEEMLGSVLR